MLSVGMYFVSAVTACTVLAHRRACIRIHPDRFRVDATFCQQFMKFCKFGLDLSLETKIFVFTE